jgi:hypothetical protein
VQYGRNRRFSERLLSSASRPFTVPMLNGSSGSI